MAEIGRLITAMVTPFDENGEVDYAQAKRLANALLDSGSDGLVITGTTGEGPTLSTEEKIRLYGEVKQAIGNRGAVIAGTTDNNTAASIELSKEAEKKINGIYKKIKPGADFGELAKKYSEDEGSAKNGGDLEYMYAGVFDPEFDKAVFALKVGEVSGVVKTSFGFHIIKLNETRPSEQAPFAEVKESIQKHLFMEKANIKVQEYIDGLRKKADIKLLY